MALVELSMLEQRYLAVREVLDTRATVTDVASRHGVDRRTLHRWLVRYANEGIGALAERSSKPDRCPHQLSAVIEARIIAMSDHSSQLGATHDPHQARQGVPRRAVALGDLSIPRPAPPHRTTAAAIRTTRAGSAPVPWSYGRWTSWDASTSPMELPSRVRWSRWSGQQSPNLGW